MHLAFGAVGAPARRTMSLFKTKEWWQTRCGADESFDGRCLLAAPLFGEERKDVLVVGSHEGYLRIYAPSSQWVDETKSPTGYKSTDSMIETKIGNCIVDLKAGRFVSGSKELCLALLTDSKLLVYRALALSEESGEFAAGDRCDLRIAYEHALPKFPASLTSGPFGGARGRDFLCVQCLDGTLHFYEQEVYAFSRTLENRLLAAPIAYVSRYDSFVTASSAWFVEGYRYQRMAEGAEKRLGSWEPDWSFNIGEAVLAIEAVTLSSFEAGIVVLGEKQLHCLKDDCATVKYAKRLEYRPVCFRAYVIEPDGKLMVLVIADTGTLIVYEGSKVKWSAQLPFVPVAVDRVELQHLQAAIVVLSEDGRLEACYLGSEPSLFVVPPLHPRGFDYAAAEEQLADLRALLKGANDLADRTGEAGAEAELIVSVTASPELRGLSPSTDDRAANGDDEARRQLTCTVAIELSSCAPLDDLQVCVNVSRPFVSSSTFYALPRLCDRHSTEVSVRVDGDWPAIAPEVRVSVTYRTAAGSLRALRRAGQLPLKMLLRSSPPETACAFATIIRSSDSLPGIAQLFPEFSGDRCQKQGSNALGLRYAHSGRTVTVVSATASNRFRVQTTDGLSSTLVVQRLIDGSRSRSLGSSVGSNHLQLVQQRMEARFAARRQVEGIAKEIELLTSQLRNVQRKMLRAVRERSERSLADTGLPLLFESTCRAIFARLDELANARKERERLGHELRCSLRLLVLLLRLNAPEDEGAALEAAIGFEPRPSDRFQDWEEIADATLATLLESASTKSGTAEARSSMRSSLAPVATGKELAKLKKRLVHVVERLVDGSRESDIAEIEPTDGNDGRSSA